MFRQKSGGNAPQNCIIRPPAQPINFQIVRPLFFLLSFLMHSVYWCEQQQHTAPSILINLTLQTI